VDGRHSDVPDGDAEPQWQSDVIDVSGVLPSDLPDSALGESLRRLAAELDDPDEPIAGFNSAL
jgi:FXSXX-COOH protein